MKTLTLEETIQWMEKCIFEGADWNEDFWSNYTDALNYLKGYRSEKGHWESDRKGYEEWIERFKDAREKHQQAVIDLKKNPPLTFDEVREMLGKPVWMESVTAKGWRLVNCFDSVTTGEKAVALTDRYGVDFVFSADSFEKCEVMVYRKERDEDAG